MRSLSNIETILLTKRLQSRSRLAEFSLDPDSEHLLHFGAVHLQPRVQEVLLLDESGSAKQFLDLLLIKEIDQCSVPSRIKVVLQTFSRLKTQLHQIVATVVPKQEQSPRLQVTKRLVNDVLHSETEDVHRYQVLVCFSYSAYFNQLLLYLKFWIIDVALPL